MKNEKPGTMPETLTIHHAKPIDAMAAATSKGAAADSVTGEVRINKLGVDFGLHKFGLKSGLGVGTNNLLIAGLAAFTIQNGFGKSKTINRPVTIPFDEYCCLVGYDISTKSRRDHAHEQIRQDLKTLQAVQLSWDDGKRWQSVNLLDSVGEVKRNRITMRFGQTFAEYLHKKPLVKIPKELMQISGKNQTAYAMASKIITHSGNNGNRKKGSSDRLKVGTLLKVSSLPDYKTVSEQGNSWRDRIRKPFEANMNVIKRAGVIKGWRYDKPISPGENYHSFVDRLVIFEMPGE